MAYTYQLSYTTRTRMIEPTKIGNIVVAKEDGEAFFREKMSGSMELAGADFDFLYDANNYSVQCCQQMALTIFKSCNGERPSTFWSGTFTMADVSWDIDGKVATVKKILVSDQYSIIFQNWHKQVNWLDILKEEPVASYIEHAPQSPDFNPQDKSNHDRCVYFLRALQWLVKKTMLGTVQERVADGDFISFSKLFFSETNPVTGKANYLKYIQLEHISEAKRPGATNPAKEGLVALKDVLEELKVMFNAYWYIEDGGRFHIEHLSFFPHYSYDSPSVSLDLTTNEYKDRMKGLNQFEFQQERLRGIEGITFSINEQSYKTKSKLFIDGGENISIQDFNGCYMAYDDTCAPKDDKNEKVIETRIASMFCTDYTGVTFKPDTIPEDGWYLVHAPIPHVNGGVMTGWCPINGGRYKNGCLSPTRLYFDFGRYENSFPFGIASSQQEKPKIPNSNPVIITERPLKSRTVIAVKSFASISLDLCCGQSYDFSGFIKHPLAEKCIVDQLEFDLTVQNVTVSVLGINTCTDAPFPDYEEEEEGTVGCPTKGVLLRTETALEASRWGATIVRLTDYYADGNCGEYTGVRMQYYIKNQ